LIHDAQYLDEHYRGQLAGFPSTQGYGHSTVSMACEVAIAAQVGRLFLFHHDPAYPDGVVAGMEAAAQKIFANARSAHEGLEVRVPAGKITSQLQPGQPNPENVQYAHHD
jgi:ribonuclease BN (tRNA processing enzyme)